MTKLLKDIPHKVAEVIKIFATIHHDHYKPGELEEINKKLNEKDPEEKKK